MKKRAADITCEVAHLWKEGQFAEAVNTLKAFVNSEVADELEMVSTEFAIEIGEDGDEDYQVEISMHEVWERLAELKKPNKQEE